MSLSQRWTVIGIFEEHGQAQQAIDELRQAGFSDEQIGFVFRNGTPVVSKADVEAEENTGAFKGGIVGGILGAADALLTPVLGPSVANTIPTATMPVAEQAIDRFQQAGTDHVQNQAEPVGVDAEREQSEEVVTPVETASGENVGATGETPPPENVGATDEKRLKEEEATGAVTGGIVGGVLGAAVALLIPVIGPAFAGGILVAVFSAALGAVTGGFLGAFVAMGVPEEQARHYEKEFTAGRTIVTVKTDDDQQKALDIMYHNGARYANAHDRS